ncbi:MAG: gamma carbonic anhydrase family protein [Planctomycetota bacterium]
MTYHTVFRPEQVADSALILPTAVVVGDVTLGEESSVWFGAVIRGDTESIRVGVGSNVQDLALLHADPGFPCLLGARVTVGHGAIVHGAVVEDDCLIGMRAVILNGARIGAGSLIAAGALIPEGVVIPPGSLVMGVPGKVVRSVTEAQRVQIQHGAEHYIEAARAYRATLRSGQKTGD